MRNGAMTSSSSRVDLSLLTTKEAARLLRLCARTLEKHRSYGTGPAYSKLGGKVLYDAADLRAWLESGLRNSTSDTARPATLPAKRHAAQAPHYRQAGKKGEYGDER